MNYNTLINKIDISGAAVWPIIEGGKGVAASDGITAGHFAKACAVGTFSGASPKYINNNGEYEPIVYKAKNRIARHEELIEYSIKAGISQARIASEIDSGNNGRIHMNILWEMGSTERTLKATLDGACQIIKGGKNLIHGITGGAGMPYKMGEIASYYNIYYHPIVSSMRAFAILWKRSFHNFSKFLGGVVYEDPWLAGGHNGLSNKEDPACPINPYGRLVELRSFMNSVELEHVPIIMAGGVWSLKDWTNYINNPEIGKIAFQFGTRPLLTQESPIPPSWKAKLMTLKPGEIYLNKFSPTGFYSSAVNNNFIQNLRGRSERQICFSRNLTDEFNTKYEYKIGEVARAIFIKAQDLEKVCQWNSLGYTEFLRTPSETIVFVSPEEKQQITDDQVGCMGCLSHCRFSNWKDHDNHTTGELPDPRSFCIQKTLRNAIDTDNIENELMFSGHNGYMFGKDSYYANGFIPRIDQLVDRILSEVNTAAV